MTRPGFLRTLRPPWSALFLLVGLVVGFAIGASVALRWLAPAQARISGLARGYVLSEMAFGQYSEAGYGAAKAALEDFMAYLETVDPKGESRDESWLDPRSVAFDKTLTAARLALLEEREGRQEEAARLWERAEAYAREAEWNDPGRANIRRLVTRLDRSVASAPPPAEDEG